ncbi:hypothetical protein N7510_000719 [Penicillium lagena]|uniref:uncharacterized protein n=1 Tax=Penicillium lagena TaxID=94218 RepID=UPI0025408F23|nr:uncharacterized protein N7510_000719 [Penicillium lagena]KAJ5624410.1 hypothetical protein N7510_000719 [Penicillium lagena]
MNRLSSPAHLPSICASLCPILATENNNHPRHCILMSGEQCPPMRSVAPDLLSIDGHVFRVNYDVPEEITLQLEELFYRDAGYEEIPEDLKAYEIGDDDADAEEAGEEARREQEIEKKKRERNQEKKRDSG